MPIVQEFSMAQAIKYAEAAQAIHIHILMLHNYVGNRCKIAQWDEFRFHLSGFLASTMAARAGWPTHEARYWLNKLVKKGIITKHQTRKSQPANYRFPLDVCTLMAEREIEIYVAEGYSQTELRPFALAAKEGK